MSKINICLLYRLWICVLFWVIFTFCTLIHRVIYVTTWSAYCFSHIVKSKGSNALRNFLVSSISSSFVMLQSRQSVLSGMFSSSSLASTSLKQSHMILTLSNYGILLTDDISSKPNIQSTFASTLVLCISLDSKNICSWCNIVKLPTNERCKFLSKVSLLWCIGGACVVKWSW